jgi:hypothetical protein
MIQPDFFLAYSSTLKMEATYSPEKSVDFQRNTRRYIPEDSTPYNHRCENLISYNCHSLRIKWPERKADRGALFPCTRDRL